MKNTTKKLILSFLIFVFFTSASAFSQEVPCGMIATADGLAVESGNYDICPEDVAFQGTYLLFADIFKDPALRSLILMFIDKETLDSPFTEFADNTINVSQGIYFLLSMVAIFSWAILTPIISVKIYTYVVMVQKTGNLDFAESRGDAVKFISYTAFLLFLIAPTGLSGGRDSLKAPLMVGQSLAIIGSLPAHMGGNYMFSTYLSSTEMSSSDVGLKEDMLLPSGQDISNTLIEGELCQMRTRQAILTINGKAGSNFFETRGLDEVVAGISQNDVISRYDKCLSYIGIGEEGYTDFTIDSLSVNKISTRAPLCASTNSLVYDPDLYGYNHTCLKVIYETGHGKFNSLLGGDETTDDVNGTSSSSMESVIETIHKTYKTKEYFAPFKRLATAKVKTILKNEEIDSDERFAALNKYFIELSKSVIGSKIQSDSSLSEGTNEQKQLKYVAVGTALLGGTISMSNTEQFWTNGLSALKSHFREYSGLNSGAEHVFGVDILIDEAKEIAQLIQRYQCAVDWKSNKETRLFVAKFNSAQDNDAIEPLFSSDSGRFECVEFLSKENRGNTDLNRYVRYPTLGDVVNNDIKETSEGIWISNTLTQEEYSRTLEKITLDIASEYFDEIRLRQAVLAGYTVAVKKAVADNLTEELSDREAENEFDANLRPRGWGVMGGALLYLGQTQNSALHMGRSIDELIKVEAGGSDNTFVDRSAFGPNRNDNVNEIVSTLFTPMHVDTILTIGQSGASSYSGPQGISKTDSDESDMAELMRILESLVFGPVDHIKSASGMNADNTLAEGFRACFDGGYDNCLSGNKHPIIALSHFGNEMMNNMLTIMTIDAVLRTVNRVAGFAGPNENGSITEDNVRRRGNKVSDYIKSIGGKLAKIAGGLISVFIKVIGAISLVATVVMDTLYPLIVTLFIAGAMFAYIIPMMSYIFGFMMLLLTLVGFFIVAVVLPLYIVIKFLNIEKEYEDGFKNFYQDILGNYLTPMFFTLSAVLAWNLIVVILFILNVTFTLIYQGLGAAGSGGLGLSGFFFHIFMYVVYLVAVFILFRFGLTIMKNMPDMLKEKLNLKKGNDEQFIDSLGFEQYVNAQVMQQVAVLPTNLAKGLNEYYESGGFKSKQALKDAADRTEDFADLIDAHGGAQEFAKKLHELDSGGQQNAGGSSPSYGSGNNSGGDDNGNSGGDDNGNSGGDDAGGGNNNSGGGTGVTPDANSDAEDAYNGTNPPNQSPGSSDANEGAKSRTNDGESAGSSSSANTQRTTSTSRTPERASPVFKVEEGTGFEGDLNGERQEAFDALKNKNKNKPDK
jgi:conjugal transfer/type IV secretion protein DotA/TraY